MFEAAVWHLRDEGDVRVDPYRAEVEQPRHAHGSAMVLRPDARRKPVPDGVCPAYGRFFGVEPLKGDDRTEDLVLDHLVGLAEPGHDGRLQEVTLHAQL